MTHLLSQSSTHTTCGWLARVLSGAFFTTAFHRGSLVLQDTNISPTPIYPKSCNHCLSDPPVCWDGLGDGMSVTVSAYCGSHDRNQMSIAISQSHILEADWPEVCKLLLLALLSLTSRSVPSRHERLLLPTHMWRENADKQQYEYILILQGYKHIKGVEPGNKTICPLTMHWCSAA